MCPGHAPKRELSTHAFSELGETETGEPRGVAVRWFLYTLRLTLTRSTARQAPCTVS